jgi:hypothetical protein
VALRPVRRWMEHAAARSHAVLAVTLASGAEPGDVIDRVADLDGVSLRLLAVEKHEGRLVAVVRVEGRPEGAVAAATARLAALDEVTDLARQ